MRPESRTRNRSPRSSNAQNRNRNQPSSSKGQDWVEPPLQESTASFEEHGGGPFGVLEDMQPLGSRPSTKVKARIKLEPPRKSNVIKSQAHVSHAADAHNTPETTPALDASDVAPHEPLPDQPLPVVDDERDQDYTPRPSKRPSKSRQSRSAAKNNHSPAPSSFSTPAGSSTPVPPPAVSTKRNSRTLRVKQSTPASPRATPPAPSKVDPPASAQKNAPASARVSTPEPLDYVNIVNTAVVKAREAGKPAIGLAIRQLYIESISDKAARALIDGVIRQTATPEQYRAFKARVDAAKKRIHEESGTFDSDEEPRRIYPPSPSPPRDGTLQQSIESPANPPKPKISLRIHKPKPTVEPVPQRATSVSSSSSLSSLTSIGEDEMVLDPVEPVAFVEPPQQLQVEAPAAVAGANGSLKRSSADVDTDDQDRVLLAKKQKLHETVNRDAPTEESHVRPDLAAVPRLPKDPIIPPVKLTANGRSNFNPQSREASADAGSPLTDISSTPLSRNATPKTTAMSTKIFKKKAKTKQSPVKKQATDPDGEPNGISRRESPAVGHDENEESDNNDYCAACQGSGYLLCCDGCDKSFHFSCLDPPLTQDASELNEPWYCFGCVAKRDQPQRHSRGLFSSLFSNLEKRNPTVFLLPQEIRDYFAGIGTSKDGRFLEQLVAKTRRGAGYDELPDNFKIKDVKGQVILCHQCGLSSLGRREIITCDACSAHWHLDCLDPPLANPPYRDHTGRKVRDWLCPLHVDQILREVEVPRLASRQLLRDRRVHMRKPRGAKIVDTALNRGFINDGVIEVAPDESDADSEFYDEEVSGVVFRLPEKGIKLDFIDRVKQTRSAPTYHHKEDTVPVKRARTETRGTDEFFHRSFLEQRTALSLIGLANQQTDLDFNGDQVSNLLGTLISEAPPEVVTQMVKAEEETISSMAPLSPPPSEQPEQSVAHQREMLGLLQKLITRKLADLAGK